MVQCWVSDHYPRLDASHILHLKGFGTGRFPPNRGGDECLVQLLLDAVGPKGAIVWDGDLFAEDSFTRILDQAGVTRKNMKEHERTRFYNKELFTNVTCCFKAFQSSVLEFCEVRFQVVDKLQVLSAGSVTAVAFYWRSLKQSFLDSWLPRLKRYSAGLHLVLLDDPGEAWKSIRRENWQQLWNYFEIYRVYDYKQHILSGKYI